MMQMMGRAIREGNHRTTTLHELAHRERIGQKNEKRASKTRATHTKPGASIQLSLANDQGGDAGNAAANGSNGGAGSGGGGGGDSGNGSEGDGDGESDRAPRTVTQAAVKRPSRTPSARPRASAHPRKSSAKLTPLLKAFAGIPLPVLVLATAILFAYTGHEDLAKTALLTLLGGRFMKPK
jgi:hypothetical protein